MTYMDFSVLGQPAGRQLILAGMLGRIGGKGSGLKPEPLPGL